MQINTALISVTDKTGLADLAAVLCELGVTIYSTGGTAKHLRDAGFAVVDISELVQFPEILDGRVKTLHPAVHAGILADTRNPAHKKQLDEMNIPAFDLVVVNFYHFDAGNSETEMIESIDIGGPTMVRAAAKNHASTAVLTDPADYPIFIGKLCAQEGQIDADYCRYLARQAFVKIAQLDVSIARAVVRQWADKADDGEDGGADEGASGAADTLFPEDDFLPMKRVMTLRYGENPHQRAACYATDGSGLVQLQGAELSYNNLLDVYSACRAVDGHEGQAAAIIKHNNPCGVACAKTQKEAFARAYRTDSMSAYGGIIAFNQTLDGATAEALVDHFWEAVVAPQFSPESKSILAMNGRVKMLSSKAFTARPYQLADIGGLVLAQESDQVSGEGEVASRRRPTAKERADLAFAWRVAAVTKSNAIVIAKNKMTCGIGAGQMSRVDSAWIACEKAKRAKHNLQGTVAASDAFFPFADGLRVLAEAGVRAVIYPAGSKNDAAVLSAADELGLAVIIATRRHFRH